MPNPPESTRAADANHRLRSLGQPPKLNSHPPKLNDHPPKLNGQITIKANDNTTVFSTIATCTTAMDCGSNTGIYSQPSSLCSGMAPSIINKYCVNCEEQRVFGWCQKCMCCLDCCPYYILPANPRPFLENQPCCGH